MAAELRTIQVCQAPICQQKGSKAVLHRFQDLLAEKYSTRYPKLIVTAWDCNGECEQGPLVRVNDMMVLRNVEKEQVNEMFENPEKVIGEIMHVLEKDRDTFDRIVSGNDII